MAESFFKKNYRYLLEEEREDDEGSYAPFELSLREREAGGLRERTAEEGEGEGGARKHITQLKKGGGSFVASSADKRDQEEEEEISLRDVERFLR